MDDMDFLSIKISGNNAIVSIPYKTILVCSEATRINIIQGNVELDSIKKPYIILTNDQLKDDEIDIVEDTTMLELLLRYEYHAGYGGEILV